MASFGALIAFIFRNRIKKVAIGISQRGVDFIKQWEGFESLPYLDIAGHKTIGYGTLLKPGHPLYNAQSISPDKAEQLLREHVAEKIEPVILSKVKVPITQNQRDALSSFIYNLGEGNFSSSTLLKKLNAGNYLGAADEFLRWNKATIGGVLQEVTGLTNRRKAERDLFLS
jgi:lysozyme